MRSFYRPIPMLDPTRPADALTLAGGWCWFDRVEVLERGRRGEVIAAAELPAEMAGRLTAPRPRVCGLGMARPRIMGILNVTPDSFSDGGLYSDPTRAFTRAAGMVAEGAEILDIGGESTRPGAAEVDAVEEAARVAPLVAVLRAGGVAAPVSVDTRKARVAAVGIGAGAEFINDVSALCFDPAMAAVVAGSGAGVCLMHAQGLPGTMQDAPEYEDVLLEVYEALEARVAAAEAAGIARERIVIDPGIGFGKTEAHNLALLRGLALFHGLGLPILLGVSRKRFIGRVGGVPEAAQRGPGSVAVGLAGVAQGAQILRVHDVGETRQALRLWQWLAAGQEMV